MVDDDVVKRPMPLIVPFTKDLWDDNKQVLCSNSLPSRSVVQLPDRENFRDVFSIQAIRTSLQKYDIGYSSSDLPTCP